MYENYLFYYRVTTFHIKLRGQEKEEISHEKGETDVEITSSEDNKFIFRVSTPFNDSAPVPDVPIKKYRYGLRKHW